MEESVFPFLLLVLSAGDVASGEARFLVALGLPSLLLLALFLPFLPLLGVHMVDLSSTSVRRKDNEMEEELRSKWKIVEAHTVS